MFGDISAKAAHLLALPEVICHSDKLDVLTLLNVSFCGVNLYTFLRYLTSLPS